MRVVLFRNLETPFSSAMLTPGEFVVKKDAVGILGLPFLKRLSKSFHNSKLL